MKKLKKSERITKIKPFIEKYNWEEIPIRRRWLEKFETNSLTVALNVLYVKKWIHAVPTFQIVKNKLFF